MTEDCKNYERTPYFREDLKSCVYRTNQNPTMAKVTIVRLTPNQLEEKKRQAEIDRMLRRFLNSP